MAITLEGCGRLYLILAMFSNRLGQVRLAVSKYRIRTIDEAL